MCICNAAKKIIDYFPLRDVMDKKKWKPAPLKSWWFLQASKEATLKYKAHFLRIIVPCSLWRVIKRVVSLLVIHALLVLFYGLGQRILFDLSEKERAGLFVGKIREYSGREREREKKKEEEMSLVIPYSIVTFFRNSGWRIVYLKVSKFQPRGEGRRRM